MAAQHHEGPGAGRTRLRRIAVGGLLALAVCGAAAKLAHRTPVHVMLFDAYGTPDRVFASGRVLEDEPPTAPSPERAWWQNLGEVLDALESDEVAGARVRLELGRERFDAATDEEGLFSSTIRPSTPLPLGSVQLHACVVGPESRCGSRDSGWLHVLPHGPAVAVVSDFDDTVAQSHVPDRARLVWEIALKNAAQIDPVPGAGQAYRNARDAGAAAFFYVSGSPINLYPRILSFLELHGVPRGPVLLKDFGRDPVIAQQDYKSRRIDSLLGAFPNLRVVLVGDSGEHDPEIYGAARDRHPGRVASIIVRIVPNDASDPDRFRAMTTVPDYEADPDVIARAVRAASSP